MNIFMLTRKVLFPALVGVFFLGEEGWFGVFLLLLGGVLFWFSGGFFAQSSALLSGLKKIQKEIPSLLSFSFWHDFFFQLFCLLKKR